MTEPEHDQTSRSTILLVDDEPSVRDTVGYSLRREGYVVAVAADGIEAMRLARSERPDVVVLDVMLPGIDGYQVCRQIRAESQVPILLLSAKGEEIDRVIGLELGADDYLVKPFAMRELLARIRAMLRRVKMTNPDLGPGTLRELPAKQTASAPQPRDDQVDAGVIVGDLEIDSARRTAAIGGVVVSLKPKEFDLLYYFACHPGIVLTRDALLRRVWGYDFPVDTRTVDVHVRWLRQKIEEDPSAPQRIETVRGYGYRYVAPPAPPAGAG